MLKNFLFECDACDHTFEALVEGVHGTPEECPDCGNLMGFHKLPSAANFPTTIVPSYPGAKQRKAGYVHTHGNRPAEKKGSQISMHGSAKK